VVRAWAPASMWPPGVHLGRPDILLGNGYHGLRLYRNRGAAEPLAGPTQPGKEPLMGSAKVGLGPDGIGSTVKGDTLTVGSVGPTTVNGTIAPRPVPVRVPPALQVWHAAGAVHDEGGAATDCYLGSTVAGDVVLDGGGGGGADQVDVVEEGAAAQGLPVGAVAAPRPGLTALPETVVPLMVREPPAVTKMAPPSPAPPPKPPLPPWPLPMSSTIRQLQRRRRRAPWSGTGDSP